MTEGIDVVSALSHISLVVPAAGRSSRMGPQNKLLLALGDRSVLECVVGSALEAGIHEVIVVTGADAADVRELMAPHPVRVVHNADHDEGMASSIRVGIRAAGEQSAGIGILPGDMPFVEGETIARLGACLQPQTIVVPYYEGRAGHPVFFAAAFRNELLNISGDAGARSVVEAHADAVTAVEIDDEGILRDIDTGADYRIARKAVNTDDAFKNASRLA